MLGRFDAPRELVNDTVIAVDELVSNSVLHAATLIVVTLEYGAGVCRCAVTDRGASGPLPPLVGARRRHKARSRVVNAVATA